MKRYSFVLFHLFLWLSISQGQPVDKDEPPEDLLQKVFSDKDINENHYLLKLSKKALKTEQYRLPKSISPKTYDISIEALLPQTFNFSGLVQINATVIQSTKEISLHYKNLTITDYRVYGQDQKELKVVATNYNEVTDIYTLVLDEELEESSSVLVALKYKGVLDDELTGLYRSSYYDGAGNRRWLVATQFEAVHARKAFPCLDEPGFKAKFTMHIRRLKNYTALTNMPKIRTEEYSDSALDTFAETPLMSTYLIAIIISDFSHLTLNGSNVQIWSQNAMIQDGHFGLNFGTNILNTFGKLFNYTNPVPKTDMVAVPDFSSGAMENWGLVTYREYLLMFNEEENSDEVQQSVGEIISHELAHMWFGNIVTLEWWEFAWLNEAFANYFQHMGTHLVKPSWKYTGRYLVDNVRPALIYDSSMYSLSISQPCETPSEISNMFGAITYKKGGSVIRMMVESFGSEIFYEALRKYIAENKFGSVRTEHLWKAIQHELTTQNPDLKISVEELMSNWINKPGHPVLFVNVTENKIHVSQKRFLINSKPANETWYVPITYTTENNPNFTSSETNVWTKDDMTIELADAGRQWVIFNVLAAGFYHVNYDIRNWYRIIKTLNSKNYLDIHEYNRVVLIDDLFNLARAGYVEYDLVLDALQYLPYETDYLVIKNALSGLQFISHRFSGYEDEELLKTHIYNLIKDVYKRHGYFDSKHDSKFTILLRDELNSIACKLGDSKCLSTAVKTFARWRKDPSKKVPKNQRFNTYCYALKEGSAEDWEFLNDQYTKTYNAFERYIIMRSLGCTKNKTLLEKYLLKGLHDFDAKDQIHHQDSIILFISAIQQGHENAMYVLDFIAKYKDKIIKKFDEESTIIKLILLASRSFTTPQRIDNYQKYINDNSLIYKPILPYLELIKQNAIYELQWYQKHSSTIIKWLYKTYPYI